ncbi:MAG: hypothetical protein GF317_23595 [Candidatus Lokiarchaeota archaeon]|nr:hypothetical protein [Candidatus Lokiarchaeota archaeon]MBD3202356.1 hypothetical protein [Candidatus Lokiarchaeota archaeon]
MARGKKVINFYNYTGKLDNVIKFLESIQEKVNYINLSCNVEGKDIKVTLSGPKDLQHLAIERLKVLSQKYLEDNTKSN